MSKMVDARRDEDFYSFLCNLADTDNSFLINTIEKCNEDIISVKEKSIASKIDLERELDAESTNAKLLSNCSQEVIDFFFKYDNSYDLQMYFKLLGLEDDFLGNIRRVVYEEHQTRRLAKEIDSSISGINKKISDEEGIILECEEKLKKNKKQLDLAISYTEDLKFLLDGAMHENGTYNKDYVTSLLNPIQGLAKDYDIEFPSDYKERALKAIFFPNDGLDVVYDRYINGMITFEPFEENRDSKMEYINRVNVEEPKVEEPVEKNIPKEKEEDIVLESTNQNEIDDNYEDEIDEQIIGNVEEESQDIEETPIEEDNEDIDVVPQEPEKEDKKDDVFEFVSTPSIEDLISDTVEEENEDYLNKFGLDDSRASEELINLVKDVSDGVINLNLETLKAMNAPDRVIYYVENGYSYLTDNELVGKINYLRGNGLNDKVVLGALENHYINMELAKIKDNVKILADNGVSFNKEYLTVLNYDLNSYIKALKDLEDYGIEPDDKEKLQYLSILTKYSNNIVPDVEVLKDYGISLLRKNGKYELGLFVNSPKELQQYIDQIVEAGEEDLVDSIPEVLAMNADVIVERINYLKNNKIEYKDGTLYSDVVYKPMAFLLEFGDNIEKLDTIDHSNSNLASKLNNEYSSVLVEILDKYYKANNTYINLELDVEEKGLVDSLKDKFEEEFGASLISKNTIKVNKRFVSKNKFERNLNYLVSALLKAGQDVMSNYKEIIMVSSLYNSRSINDEDLFLGVKENGGKEA